MFMCVCTKQKKKRKKKWGRFWGPRKCSSSMNANLDWITQTSAKAALIAHFTPLVLTYSSIFARSLTLTLTLKCYIVYYYENTHRNAEQLLCSVVVQFHRNRMIKSFHLIRFFFSSFFFTFFFSFLLLVRFSYSFRPLFFRQRTAYLLTCTLTHSGISLLLIRFFSFITYGHLFIYFTF